MDLTTLRSFVREIQSLVKTSSPIVPALEVGGLGVLARPSWQSLRKPGATQEEKSHAKHELAGLGILAAHPAYELGKHLLKRP